MQMQIHEKMQSSTQNAMRRKRNEKFGAVLAPQVFSTRRNARGMEKNAAAGMALRILRNE